MPTQAAVQQGAEARFCSGGPEQKRVRRSSPDYARGRRRLHGYLLFRRSVLLNLQSASRTAVRQKNRAIGCAPLIAPRLRYAMPAEQRICSLGQPGPCAPTQQATSPALGALQSSLPGESRWPPISPPTRESPNEKITPGIDRAREPAGVAATLRRQARVGEATQRAAMRAGNARLRLTGSRRASRRHFI